MGSATGEFVTNDLSGKAPAQRFLSGCPGAAVLVDGEAVVHAANDKGASIRALMEHGAAPEISALIENAAAKGAIAAGLVSLQDPKGEIFLDVTVIPRGCGDLHLVIARDLTMERNLRSALVESRQRYKDLVEISNDFSWEVGPDKAFVFVSPQGALGYKAGELVGKNPGRFVRNKNKYAFLPFLSNQPVSGVEIWMERSDGAVACVLVSCVPLIDDGGVWLGARGICRDVTLERERESALNRARHREQLLNYVVNTIRDEVEPLNMLTAASAATGRALLATGCRIYRMQEGSKFITAAEDGDTDGVEIPSAFLESLGASGSVEVLDANGWQILATATRYRQKVNGAICLWKPVGQDNWDSDTHILAGDVANQLGIANEQITNHEHIVMMSRTDSMTGMLNRRAFFEQELPRRISRLKRTGEMAALFYVDMDNFKRVNDVHGHQAGDDAIIALRDLLFRFSRPGDELARLGGDEFAVWLGAIPPEVAVKRACDLLVGSRELRKRSGSEDYPLGISLGIAIFDPKSEETLDDLIVRADAAMYAVKHKSKGGFAIAPSPSAGGEPKIGIIAPNGKIVT